MTTAIIVPVNGSNAWLGYIMNATSFVSYKTWGILNKTHSYFLTDTLHSDTGNKSIHGDAICATMLITALFKYFCSWYK